MKLLFPAYWMPTSKSYDLSLLFVLLRNICHLDPPASTGSWDEKPLLNDTSPAADVVRIKYYTNKFCVNSTGVEPSEHECIDYLSDILSVLDRMRPCELEHCFQQVSLVDELFPTLKTKKLAYLSGIFVVIVILFVVYMLFL